VVTKRCWGGLSCFGRAIGCGEDTYQVSGKALSGKWIPLTAGNISSLVIETRLKIEISLVCTVVTLRWRSSP